MGNYDFDKVTFLFQTVYRETETQTEPFTPEIVQHQANNFPEIDTEYRPDVLALSSLKHGAGLKDVVSNRV